MNDFYYEVDIEDEAQTDLQFFDKSNFADPDSYALFLFIDNFIKVEIPGSTLVLNLDFQRNVFVFFKLLSFIFSCFWDLSKRVFASLKSKFVELFVKEKVNSKLKVDYIAMDKFQKQLLNIITKLNSSSKISSCQPNLKLTNLIDLEEKEYFLSNNKTILLNIVGKFSYIVMDAYLENPYFKQLASEQQLKCIDEKAINLCLSLVEIDQNKFVSIKIPYYTFVTRNVDIDFIKNDLFKKYPGILDSINLIQGKLKTSYDKQILAIVFEVLIPDLLNYRLT